MGETFENSEAEERILKAALKVVNEETISGTRMHLIADKADMAQSNIHYYYKTKDELMLNLLDYVINECVTTRIQDRKKAGNVLEGNLHVFFIQKKKLLKNKKDFDFAEINFVVQAKTFPAVRSRFAENYMNWRDEIREVIIRYCPELPDDCKELIPYFVVSLLQGATIQSLVDPKNFDADKYFDLAEKMTLSYIELLLSKK